MKLLVVQLLQFWFRNFENADIILEYTRSWLLLLSISEKLVISKCILIEEYKSQSREFNYRNSYLFSLLKFKFQ